MKKIGLFLALFLLISCEGIESSSSLLKEKELIASCQKVLDAYQNRCFCFQGQFERKQETKNTSTMVSSLEERATISYLGYFEEDKEKGIGSIEGSVKKKEESDQIYPFLLEEIHDGGRSYIKGDDLTLSSYEPSPSSYQVESEGIETRVSFSFEDYVEEMELIGDIIYQKKEEEIVVSLLPSQSDIISSYPTQAFAYQISFHLSSYQVSFFRFFSAYQENTYYFQMSEQWSLSLSEEEVILPDSSTYLSYPFFEDEVPYYSSLLLL